MRIPRRILACAAICLALGLLTTVAIAWTSAAVQQASAQYMSVRDLAPSSERPRTAGHLYFNALAERASISLLMERSNVLVYSPPPPMTIDDIRAAMVQFLQSDTFPAWGRVPSSEETQVAPSASNPQWIQDARGWPRLALWCEWRNTDVAPSQSRGGLDLQPYIAANPENSLRALPYRPIPLGLTLDTLFYATLWSLLLFAPRAIRTHLRRRRNLCQRCAYSLASLSPGSPCPECGRQNPAQPTAPPRLHT